jgi:hypothetical protein
MLPRPVLKRFAAIALVLSVGLLAAYALTPSTARLDDPYIALHSARALLSGADAVFNVPALVGVTSPLYLGLLAVILAPGIVSGDAALRLANAIGIVAYAAAVWRLGASVDLSKSRRVVLLVIAFATGWIAINLTNGLETGCAMALMVFAIASARDGRTIAVACAAGLLPALRPDLAPAGALLLLYSIRGRPRVEQARAIALAVALAAPFAIWVRLDTGAWLPDTMRAKQMFYAEGCLPWTPKAASVAASMSLLLLQLVPLCFGVLFLPRDALGRIGLVAIGVFVVAYYVALPGALTHHFMRYPYACVVPWLCYGFALGLRRVATSVAATIAIAVVGAQMAMSGRTAKGFSYEDMKATAEWVDAHVPADATVLLHDAGLFSELAHRRAVDLVGLKTPSSIDAHARWTWASCGPDRHRAVGEIARSSGATWFIARIGWDAPLRADLEAEGFGLTPLRTSTDRVGGYTVYRLTPPGSAVR